MNYSTIVDQSDYCPSINNTLIYDSNYCAWLNCAASEMATVTLNFIAAGIGTTTFSLNPTFPPELQNQGINAIFIQK